MGADSQSLLEWTRFAAMDLRPRLARRLLDAFGGPGAVLEATAASLRDVEGVTTEWSRRILSAQEAKPDARWLEFAKERGMQVIPADSPLFPPLLHETPDTPVALFVWGNPEALATDAVAMVGTRKATSYGRNAARTIAADLARAGITVVSGGAIGIDAHVHEGASSTGATVAVLGCGLDIKYPAANQELFTQVSRKGAVISEFALGARPDIWRFPARNRIISGMCRATIVIEAAEKSGALITAEFAMEQGREVMALPGPVTSGASRGCHTLIRDGATLIEDAGQVLEAIGWAPVGTDKRRDRQMPPPDLPIDQGALLLALAVGQKHLDELAHECGLAPAQAGAAVTLLEMKGLIRRIPGNHFVRA